MTTNARLQFEKEPLFYQIAIFGKSRAVAITTEVERVYRSIEVEIDRGNLGTVLFLFAGKAISDSGMKFQPLVLEAKAIFYAEMQTVLLNVVFVKDVGSAEERPDENAGLCMGQAQRKQKQQERDQNAHNHLTICGKDTVYNSRITTGFTLISGIFVRVTSCYSLRTKSLQPKSVKIITLGCSKNTVDSEVLKSQLEANHFHVEHETEHPAEVVVINTCGFIDLAKEESVNTILDYAKEKQAGRLEKLYVTGCLSQRYKDNLEEEIPEVDAYFGTMELPALLKTMGATYRDELLGERSLVTPPHYAFLKISEGCNRTCSFCAIPLMRGKHVSRPIESLVEEAHYLARRGVRELMLIAQELTYYGLDLYQRRALPELLDKLCEVEGIEWIRLHYAYPHKFPLEVIEVMKRQPKVCDYLDMPLQHISDPVLKRMRRQITEEETKNLISRIREIHPGIRLRTTFLVGFPGETEEDHQALCRFVEETRFDRVGVFQYSHEEGTSGYSLEDDVSPDVKSARAEEIMNIQRGISLEKNQKMVGAALRVIVDRREAGQYIARSAYDSPEVDNEIWITTDNRDLQIGGFMEVVITDADEYDLFAVPSEAYR